MCLLVFTRKHVSEAAGWLARTDDKAAPGERKAQLTDCLKEVCRQAEFSE